MSSEMRRATDSERSRRINQQLVIFIPVSPPGINQQYKIGRRAGRASFYMSQRSREWADKAALIIGSEASRQGWLSAFSHYRIKISLAKTYRFDLDAPIKLVIDTISRKLGFNDKCVDLIICERAASLEEGVQILLEGVEG